MTVDWQVVTQKKLVSLLSNPIFSCTALVPSGLICPAKPGPPQNSGTTTQRCPGGGFLHAQPNPADLKDSKRWVCRFAQGLFARHTRAKNTQPAHQCPSFHRLVRSKLLSGLLHCNLTRAILLDSALPSRAWRPSPLRPNFSASLEPLQASVVGPAVSLRTHLEMNHDSSCRARM